MEASHKFSMYNDRFATGVNNQFLDSEVRVQTATGSMNYDGTHPILRQDAIANRNMYSSGKIGELLIL